MLFLHKHWRVEADIIGDSATYQEEFFKAVEIFPPLKEMASRRLDIKKARDKLEEDTKQAPEAAEGMNNILKKMMTSHKEFLIIETSMLTVTYRHRSSWMRW